MKDLRLHTGVLIGSLVFCSACSETNEAQRIPEIDMAEMRLAELLWTEITSNDGYTQWAPMPGAEKVREDSSGVHGAYRRVFINEIAAGSVDALAEGAIFVKENLRSDSETDLDSITVMKKIADYAPDIGDWFWAKFNPDGSIQQTDGAYLVGTPDGCLGCHDNPDDTGGDYVFLNNDDKVTFGKTVDVTRALDYWKQVTEDDSYLEWNDFAGKPGKDTIYKNNLPRHAEYNRVFVNQIAETDLDNLAFGSIIMKENLNSEDASDRDSITLMVRIENYAPDGYNWFWAKYDPQGNVWTEGGLPLAGQVGKGAGIRCLGCHTEAGTEGDYVFLNDIE